MSTPILKVISQYCGVYVDDVRLQELAETNAALYARKMYNYFLPAISLFQNPADMNLYLMGTEAEPKFSAPTIDSYQYLVIDYEISDFTLSLGSSYSGFELAGCQLRTYDEFGNVNVSPMSINYDMTTGNVIVHVPEDCPIPPNSVLDFDFYTDGFFENNLSNEIMNILGMCFKVVWQNRFNTNWLNMVPKIEDRTFVEQNRANKMNADSIKLQNDLRWLNEEMQKFENNLYIRQIVPASMRVKI